MPHLIAARYAQESAAAYLDRGETTRGDALCEHSTCALDAGVAECRQLLGSPRRSIPLEPSALPDALSELLEKMAGYMTCAQLKVLNSGFADLASCVAALRNRPWGAVQRRPTGQCGRRRCPRTRRRVLRKRTITVSGQGFSAPSPNGQGLELLVQFRAPRRSPRPIDNSRGQSSASTAKLPVQLPRPPHVGRPPQLPSKIGLAR